MASSPALSSPVTQPSPETMFTLSRVGDAAMVILSCPAVREWQSSVLSNYLAEVVEHNRGKVVLDVAGISQFTCAWLNSLISLADRSHELGGLFVVVGMSRQGKRLMRDAGLTKRLRLAESGEEALSLLGSSSVAPGVGLSQGSSQSPWPPPRSANPRPPSYPYQRPITTIRESRLWPAVSDHRFGLSFLRPVPDDELSHPFLAAHSPE